MDASVAANPLTQIPISNSTQILTASAQVPMSSVVASTPVVTPTQVVASTPIVASTPVMTSTPIVASAVQQVGVPVAQPVVTTIQQPQAYNTASNFTSTQFPPVPDDDYRLGRGILDDFRPNAYKTQVASSTLAVTSPGLAVSTPVTNVGASNINDFL